MPFDAACALVAVAFIMGRAFSLKAEARAYRERNAAKCETVFHYGKRLEAERKHEAAMRAFRGQVMVNGVLHRRMYSENVSLN